ncbi:MAG: alkaline phosphatase D family protein [Caulobacterales bacterium]|nr:alkaline phosphatase D family protein [Caulobacterales bacterium]
MTRPDRRRLLQAAAALGATAAFGRAAAAPSPIAWTERRDLYPQGVASGDPKPDSVILWTRSPGEGASVPLTVEVAEDPEFRRVVASARTQAHAAMGWTTRVLVAGLKPAHLYWYRFTDAKGQGSRLGRTITAPAPDDARPLRFAFVSCQNVNQGAQNAYRRMLFEDRQAPPDQRLQFVLHLGDFIYELVWYPDDRPQGMYDRRLRDVVRYASGRKVKDFHVPTTLDDYRAVYAAYLTDPDLQDARAEWPFVSIGDNHEFSWKGWQSQVQYYGPPEAGQTLRVAANQAWYEFQPARVAKSGAGLDTFDAPQVTNVLPTRLDDHGLGLEPNNLTALKSMTAYRALRFGRHLDLILTDLHSYRSQDPTGRDEADAFSSKDFPELFPEEAQKLLDAGRTANGGHPPATIRFGDKEVPNFRRDEPAHTILGAEQKAWFLKQLAAARATWKVWGVTQGVLDWRADPQNLPADVGKPWPGAGYAGFGGGDHGAAYVERGEIYDFVRTQKISGFASIAGDRHSFWAGRAAAALPPERFEPVGVSFVTGSISAPGLVEGLEHNLPKAHALRPLFLADRADGPPEPTVNLTLKHGVRSALEYAAHRDLAKAHAVSNPDNAPHLDFIDMGGHGYAVVTVSAEALACDFVCIPRPLERNLAPDGGPLRYRVRHEAALWRPGETPKLTQRVLEGDPGLSI